MGRAWLNSLGDRASVKGVDRKINDPTTMWGKHFTLYTFTALTDWEFITTGLTGSSDRSLGKPCQLFLQSLGY